MIYIFLRDSHQIKSRHICFYLIHNIHMFQLDLQTKPYIFVIDSQQRFIYFYWVHKQIFTYFLHISTWFTNKDLYISTWFTIKDLHICTGFTNKYLHICAKLGTFKWWTSGLMLYPLFFLISRLNNACSPQSTCY